MTNFLVSISLIAQNTKCFQVLRSNRDKMPIDQVLSLSLKKSLRTVPILVEWVVLADAYQPLQVYDLPF